MLHKIYICKHGNDDDDRIAYIAVGLLAIQERMREQEALTQPTHQDNNCSSEFLLLFG